MQDRQADEASITAITSQYAFTIDARDYDGVKACFTPDADCHYSRVRGDPDRLVAYFREVLADVDVCMHFPGRHRIDWLGADEARCFTYALALYAEAGAAGLPTANRVVGVTYDDHFVRTAEGWRIKARRATSLYQFAGVPVGQA